ncbi:MAG: bifunctional DNA primase/polymerase [Bacteroidota bacterium]
MLTFLGIGWSVFPCWRRRNDLAKRPCVAWQVYQQRHPTPYEVALWEVWFDVVNVAIVTGTISGIIVIDCDSVEAISAIESMMDRPTTTVRTARGRHYYFKHPGGVISSCEELLPGVDVRADKGYVLAPGSLHPSGFEYAWITTPWDVAPAPLPDALRAMVIARNTESRRIGALSLPPPVSPHRYRIGWTILRSELERLRAIPLTSGHGKQRAMAASAFRMGQLVATGYMKRAQVRDELLRIWCKRWKKPLVQGQRTIDYGLTSGQQQPRRL